MDIIGLTGGLASGKSTVATMLRERGAAIVDADAGARDVVIPGQSAYIDIVNHFGPGVLHEDGTLDRQSLATIVFSDSAERAVLEKITHPRIMTWMHERIEFLQESAVPLIIAQIPLLFETGMQDEFSRVLLAYVDEETQRRRLMTRDDIDESTAKQRIAMQLPLPEKRARAMWIIDNNGTVENTERQVVQWWQRVLDGP